MVGQVREGDRVGDLIILDPVEEQSPQRILECAEDEVVCLVDTNLLARLPEVTTVQIVDNGRWPGVWRCPAGGHLLIEQPGRPPPPVERTAAEAIGQAGEVRGRVP